MRDELRRESSPRGRTSNGTRSQGRYVVPFTLSREEEALGVEAARSRLPQLMAACATEDKSSWTRVKIKSRGMNLWEKRSVKDQESKKKKKKRGSSCSVSVERASSDSSCYCVRSSTTVHAPLDTVLKVLDASVTTAYRSFSRLIYANLVAHTSVLFHSSAPRPDFQVENDTASYDTLSVRWLVCRCSNPLVSDCDFCFQEYTKRHSIDELSINSHQYSNNKPWKDSGSCDGLHGVNEMPMAYKLIGSIETKHCPELVKSHRVVRCHVPLGGFLLYPTHSSDKTDVVFYMSLERHTCGDGNDSGGPAKGTQCSDGQFRAIQSVVRQMALHIGRLENAVESYTMGLHLESLQTLQWVHNAERSQCVICCRRFHQLTRRRHHCRLCKEVICRECSVHKNVALPTFGPTVLRICSRCNDFHSLSHSKASPRSERNNVVASENPQKHLTADQDMEKDKFKLDLMPTPFFHPPPTGQRSKNATGGNVQNVPKTNQSQDHIAVQELKQRASCSKVASSSFTDGMYFGKKTEDNRMMKPSCHRSSSETFSSPLHNKARDLHNRFQQPVSIDDRDQSTGDQVNDVEEKNSVSLGAGGTKSQALTRTWQDPSIGNNNDDNETSTSSTSSIPQKQDRPWIHRHVETPQLYEDILLKLCEHAALVRPCQFVALTLFTRAAQGDQNQLDEVESAVHFLKAKGKAKLMKVAANLRCCDPVFHLQKSVITRNTWALDETAIHPSQYDFRQLPIVLGPQRARFYAGVPLTDTQKRYRYGALAVFDAKVSSGHDNDLVMQKTLQALQVCACEAMMAIDERRKDMELRTFLKSPLLQLRQSEPAMHLATDRLHSKSSLYRDIGSIDGDCKDIEVTCNQQRAFEVKKGCTNSPTYSKGSNVKAGKSRVESLRSKMQELVQRAHDTQTQMVENILVMKPDRVSSLI